MRSWILGMCHPVRTVVSGRMAAAATTNAQPEPTARDGAIEQRGVPAESELVDGTVLAQLCQQFVQDLGT
ncbi:hypothetical protein GCM10027445_26630 [Amycolatopsis endophytica]